MKNYFLKLAIVVIFSSPTMTIAASSEVNTSRTWLERAKAVVSSDSSRIWFKDAFPTPFYRKSYFGATVTGAAIVGAGVFSYLTAGAGAPAAATGVSWVASTVAGGGAGSYMAGLSTVGGWFGGNAMLGSAILNGISLGVGGAGSSMAGLSLMGKVSVATSMSATMLDGVAIFQKYEGGEIEYYIALDIPSEIETARTKWVVDQLAALQKRQLEMLENGEPDMKQTVIAEAKYLESFVRTESLHLLEHSSNPRDLTLMAVLAHNQGDANLFDQLVAKAEGTASSPSSYLSYLIAIRALRSGDNNHAKRNLEQALLIEPYAIEPALLLINLLANEDFTQNEPYILRIADSSQRAFDADKYQTRFSLVSLRYRLGSLYLNEEKYTQAARAFETAYKEFGFIERHVFGNPNIGIVQIGQANALFGMGETAKADALVEEAVAGAKTIDDGMMLRAAYAGNVANSASEKERLLQENIASDSR